MPGGGELFSGFVKISESYLASAMKVPEHEIKTALHHLDKLNVVVYQPLKNKPQLTFLLSRQDAAALPLDVKRLEERKKLTLSKVQAMINYVTSEQRCRMQWIQEYFNEQTDRVCGLCDVCVRRKKETNQSSVEELRNEIMTIVRKTAMPIERLEEQLAPRDTELFVEVVRDLVDEGLLIYDDAWKLHTGTPSTTSK
jgi:ATP-dependent DNA helicase RecQ